VAPKETLPEGELGLDLLPVWKDRKSKDSVTEKVVQGWNYDAAEKRHGDNPAEKEELLWHDLKF